LVDTGSISRRVPRAIMIAKPYINSRGENLLIFGFGIGDIGMRISPMRGTRKVLFPGFFTGLSWNLAFNLVDAILVLKLIFVKSRGLISKVGEPVI
ncbi:hypothetical protein ACFLT3_02425, partial [Chloroflexota bacterium]